MAEQSDLWFYYQMMQQLHASNYNLFNTHIIKSYANYLNVGLYQLGASLNLTQRLFIFPYFTTYFYFSIIFISLHEIINRFINTYWKKIILFCVFTILFIILYLYCNPPTYTVLVGNIETAFLFSLIILPNFLYIKAKWSLLWFIILFTGYLFYNETSIMIEIFYICAFLIFIVVQRKKYDIKISYFITFLIVSSLPFLLFAYDGLTLNIQLFILKFKLITNLILAFTSFDVLCLLGYVIVQLPILNFINNWKIIRVINDVWTNKVIEIWLLSKLKNKKTLLFVKLFFIFVVTVITVVSCIGLGFNQNIFDWINIIGIILAVIFSLIFATIVWFNEFNSYFIFYITLLFIIFVFHVGFAANNLHWWIFQRITYCGLFPVYFEEGFIHDLVLLTFFVLLLGQNQKLKEFIKLHLHLKNTIIFSRIGLIGISTVTATVAIVVPTVLNSIGIDYVATESITDTQLLGLSKTTWEILENINFKNKLTFCDFYLPIANNTEAFNLNHILYPPYANTSGFYKKLDFFDPLYTVNSQLITNYDLQEFNNEILPYYNFVVLKSNDQFLLSILNKNQRYKILENINNQLLIYKNNNVNQELQQKFLSNNPQVN